MDSYLPLTTNLNSSPELQSSQKPWQILANHWMLWKAKSQRQGESCLDKTEDQQGCSGFESSLPCQKLTYKSIQMRKLENNYFRSVQPTEPLLLQISRNPLILNDKNCWQFACCSGAAPAWSWCRVAHLSLFDVHHLFRVLLIHLRNCLFSASSFRAALYKGRLSVFLFSVALPAVYRFNMRTFTRSLSFLLLALGLCSLPWTNAGPAVTCDTEIPCSTLVGRSSFSPTSDFSKRQDITNAERLRKRLPLKPPTHIRASFCHR